MNDFGEKISFIWSVAKYLRVPYRPNQYKDVMLQTTVLPHLDCVLEPTKDQVLEKIKSLIGGKVTNLDPIQNLATGFPFHNFGFEKQTDKLEQSERCFLLATPLCENDLHPKTDFNIGIGYIFEELIRRFDEASNEEGSDHFTPSGVSGYMVNLLISQYNDVFTIKRIVKTLFCPSYITGGMLSESEEYFLELSPNADLEISGQDYNAQAIAICGSKISLKAKV